MSSGTFSDERPLTPEELKDAVVIDSEGYVYGYVEGLEVRHDEVLLKVYWKRKVRKTKIDVEALRRELFKAYMKTRKIPLASQSSFEKEVRRIAGVPEGRQLTVDDYLRYADYLKREKGIEVKIPRIEVKKEEREAKGFVRVREIKHIAKGSIAARDGRGEIKYTVVLLNRPKEATYAGRRIRAKAPYVPPEKLRGMWVLDPRGHIVGYAEDLAVGAGGVGIKVVVPARVAKGVNLHDLASVLETYPDYARYAKKLKRFLRENVWGYDPYHVDISALGKLKNWMRLESFPPRLVKLVDRYVEEIPISEGEEIYLSWDCIEKIGDVIILKEDWEKHKRSWGGGGL